MKKKDSSRELAVAAADLAADGKALDISVLELREISSVADYFVLASGRSHIQVESICDRIVEGLRDRLGQKPISVEGLENAQWAVLDFGSVVIHVFQESVRKLYDLERLWSLAPRWKHGEEPPRAAAGKTAAVATTAKAGKATAAKARAGKVTAVGKAPTARAKAKAAGSAAPAKAAPARTAGAKKATSTRSRATGASGSSEEAGATDPSDSAGPSGTRHHDADPSDPRKRIARA